VLCAVGLAGIWLAYALFAAFPNIIFMMLMCVVLGAGVFFVAEYLSLVSRNSTEVRLLSGTMLCGRQCQGCFKNASQHSDLDNDQHAVLPC
jgi:hypothetical protein